MLITKNHISTAKRFFQRTLKSFKSFLSKGEESSYRKLPKNTQRIIKETLQENDHMNSSSYYQSCDTKRFKLAADDHDQDTEVCKRELRMRMVANSLKKMEMVDKSNVDHLLDIEEAFHYYSRLTCPAYLDIFDRFFLELQAEFDHSFKFLQGDDN